MALAPSPGAVHPRWNVVCRRRAGGTTAVKLAIALGACVSTTTVNLALPTPRPGTSLVVALIVSDAASASVTTGEVAFPVASTVIGAPRSPAGVENWTVAPDPPRSVCTDRVPCHPPVAPSESFDTLSLEALGDVQFTIGGLPTVTVHGLLNAPGLPAGSTVVATTEFAPTAKVTGPRLACPSSAVV